MLKRSWLSIKRKTSRTIILVLILFVMANLMLATIAIKSAVGESISYAKQTLGGTVYLQPDMEKIRSEAMENAGSAGGTTSGRMRVAIERPSISVELVNNLAESEYVKDYTYGIQGSANAKSYTPIETEQQKMRKQIESQMESGQESIGNFPGGGGGMFSFANGDTTVVGINSFAFITDVEAGNMKLSSGEIFDESTGNGVIISYDLATENDLEIGSEIILTTTSEDNATDITLSVIGIYDNTTENFDPNTIYTNIDTAANFLSETDYNDGNYSVGNVKYYLVSAEYKDAFIAESNEKYSNLASDNLAISIDDSAYQQMVGPIESVGSFATTILWIVVIASVVIITLIITINIKDRRYEMGVLMSLGATKKNLLGQTLTELLVIGTAAFALSIVPSAFIARAMGSGLLDQQISMNEQSQTQNYGRGNNAGGGGFSGSTSSNPSTGGPNMSIGGNQNTATSNVEAIDEIDVTPTTNDYLILFLAGYSIIILALILPTANILRFQPKTILTGKE